MITISFRRQYYRFVLASLLTVVLATLGMGGLTSAQSTAISRGYTTTTEDTVRATLVSTTGKDDKTIELATVNGADKLVGIVSETSLLQLSGSKKNQTQVVISGTTVGLVSDINGSIRAGDKITVSPIDGVGMLATDDSQIVGTAQTSFNAKNAKTREITDKSGKSHTVHIGSVPIQVGIAYYVPPTSKLLPPFLQNLANNIAGRPVSAARILLGSVLLLLAFISIFALIYTSVRAGIISLGRNPLAAGAIQRGLVGVAMTTFLVFVFTLLATYLILIY